MDDESNTQEGLKQKFKTFNVTEAYGANGSMQAKKHFKGRRKGSKRYTGGRAFTTILLFDFCDVISFHMF